MHKSCSETGSKCFSAKNGKALDKSEYLCYIIFRRLSKYRFFFYLYFDNHLITVERGGSVKDVWNAMADPTRREILNMLQKRNMTAGEIAEQFETSAATVSHHLKILRETGLILSEKEKQTITYSLNTTVFQDFLKDIAQFFGTKGEPHETE